MKLPCEVIRDVLPLYAEDMVSPATKALVEEHLPGCEGCSRELEELKGNKAVAVDVELHGLQRIQKEIRLRRVLAVLAVLMSLVCIGIVGYVFLNTPIYLEVGDAIEGITLQEDGGLVIDYARGAHLRTIQHDNQRNYSFFCDSTRYKMYQARKIDYMLVTMTEAETEEFIKEYFQIEQIDQKAIDLFYDVQTPVYFYTCDGAYYWEVSHETPLDTVEYYGQIYEKSEHTYSISYANRNGEMGTMLWMGSDTWPPEITEQEETATWRRAFHDSTVSFVLFMFLYFLLAKRKHGEWLFVSAMLCGSIAFSIVLVSNLDFSAASGYFSWEWERFTPMTVLSVFSTTLIWRKIYRTGKQYGV